MKEATRQRIVDCWNAMDDDDASTPMLLQMVADAQNVSYSTVVKALTTGPNPVFTKQEKTA